MFTTLKKMTSPPQLSMAASGREQILSVNEDMLMGKLLCKSCADNKIYSDFLSALSIPCLEDIICCTTHPIIIHLFVAQNYLLLGIGINEPFV